MLNKILQFLWILILLPASLLGCTGGDASEGVTPSQTALPISTPIEVETPSPNPSSLPFLPIITGNLAFSSRRDDTNNDGTLDSQDGIHLYKLDLETNALLKLTDGDQWDIWPEWSPDGEHLAFTSNREGDDHIYIVNADGSNMRQLTTGLGHQGQPCWSPNGQQIAYIQSEGVLRSNGDLFAINIDGTNMIQITSSVGNETAPDWLPDGRYIIFSREEYGDRVENFIGQIWIYDIKTKTEWQLVPDVIGYPSDLTLSFEQPRWLHPDGQFVSLSVVTLTMDTIHYAFGVYELDFRQNSVTEP